jgi:hypothetical protein
MPSHHLLFALSVSASLAMAPALARSAEFYVGDSVEQDNLEIVPNYLTGIDMDHMPKGAEIRACDQGRDARLSRGRVDSLSHHPLQAY